MKEWEKGNYLRGEWWRWRRKQRDPLDELLEYWDYRVAALQQDRTISIMQFLKENL